jgi:hypothetical protein
VALADEAEHAAEPRLGELQRPAALLFALEHHDLLLANHGLLLLVKVGLGLAHGGESLASGSSKNYKKLAVTAGSEFPGLAKRDLGRRRA